MGFSKQGNIDPFTNIWVSIVQIVCSFYATDISIIYKFFMNRNKQKINMYYRHVLETSHQYNQVPYSWIKIHGRDHPYMLGLQHSMEVPLNLLYKMHLGRQ